MNLMGTWARRAVRGCGALLALGLLASCGGGTEQITPFAPTRLIVLGDEMSVLTKLAPQGLKYSVNALNSENTVLDCVARPIWHQAVAYTYLFSYAECDPGGLGDNRAKIYAVPGAKVDDLPAQLALAKLANGGAEWSNTDLFTLLVGANDVLDLFERVYLPDPTTDNLNAVIAELQTRGVRVAQFINELTRADVTGPKVIVSTIPLMNLTPYAIKLAALRPLVDVRSALQQFSQAFNTALRAGNAGQPGIINDGRFIGLVELDAILNAGVGDPGRYGLVNVTQAVCAVPLPDCDTSTLVPNGNATTWLWASELWMGSTAHLNLGNYARGRALGNPF